MYNGSSVADFCGGFSGTRRLTMLRRRVPENPPQKSATEPPIINVCKDETSYSILFIIKSTFLPSRDEPSDSLSTCFSSSEASSRSS